MAITNTDIKLLKSAVMADVPEGGGAVTGNVVIDGQSNNLFPDISELASTYGEVGMRKVFAGVRTDDTESLYGCRIIVSDPPDDPAVSAVIFSADGAFDTRVDAQSRVESYLTRGPEYAGLLFGDVVAGMRAFSILQRTSVPAPPIGTTLLMMYREGQAAERSQYVRIVGVESIEREFAVPGAEERTFKRLQVNVEISDELRASMTGCTAADSYRDSTVDFTAKTRLYGVVVADAARYYGCKPLATPITFDAGSPVFSVEVGDIYDQIVPSAQVETGVADARMNQQTAAVVPIGGQLTQTITGIFTTTQSMYVGGGILPGSLTLQRSGVTLTDSGGKLMSGSAEVGAIDYANGLLVLSTNVFSSGSGSHTISYVPAAAPTVVSRSVEVPVTQQSQRLTYVLTLDPVPARGSLQVSYWSGGRWYVLEDNGAGALLGGTSGVGGGTLNRDTGTVAVTLGALPDVGSSVIYTWAPVAGQSSVSTASSLDMAGRLHADVMLPPFKAGALTLTWTDSGQARTASDDGAGALTGSATGKCWYGSGRLQFSPNSLPPVGTSISWSLTAVTPQAVELVSLVDGGSTWSGALTGAPVKARSVRMAAITLRPVRQHPGDDVDKVELMQLFDDGAGVLYVVGVSGSLPVGTIDYATGAFTLNKATSGYTERQGVWERRTPFGAAATDPTYVTYIGDTTRSITLTILASAAQITGNAGQPDWCWWTTVWGAAVVRAQYGGSDAAAQTGTFMLSPLRLAVSAWAGQGQMSAASFSVGSDRYVTRGYDVVRNPSAATGDGEVVGTVSAGALTVAAWSPGAAPTVSNPRIGTQAATFAENLDLLLDAAIFRTAASPIKPGAFSVAGKYADGATFSASAGLDGVINSGGVIGRFDFKSGIGRLRFGTPVATPSNPLSPPTGVVDLSYLGISGVSWVKLRSVQADTLRYNATAYTYVPLDADILGLDPVRLPSDGRVPIFRKGSVVVVHHTGVVGPATVTIGQTINCGRQRLASVRIVGANGAAITTGYTVNLDAGTVAITDTSGWAQPVTIRHRVEDMRVVADAQITGTLRMTAPLTHNFPAGSFVSSALLVGNMYARVSDVFDQSSWTGVWSDDQIGDAASGTLDTINSPIVVTNLGAVTERFRLTFTSTTAFICNAEHLGQIGTGTINATFAPVNPATQRPYFSIPPTAWGAGWSVGNTVRINTVGALAPVWIARVIKPGAGTVSSDAFTVSVLADIDNPN